MALSSACEKSGETETPVVEAPKPYDYPGFNIRPANPESPYAKYAEFVAAGKIPDLPTYIGENGEVTVEEILDRTYVSHLWIRDRFAEVLRKVPQDLLNLASCAKSFVIQTSQWDANYGGGGLVRLSGEYLAVTPDEASQTSSKTAFDSQAIRWTYRGNYTNYAHENRQDSVFPTNAFVLTHELFHACDDKISKQTGNLPSRELSADTEKDLAYQLFYSTGGRTDGNKYSLEGKTPDEIGADFAKNPLVSFYSFYSPHEDYATLGSTLLTKAYLGLEITEILIGPQKDERNLQTEVLWALKNKVCAPQVAARARAAIASTGMKFNDRLIEAALSDCEPENLEAGGTVKDTMEKTYVAPFSLKNDR